MAQGLRVLDALPEPTGSDRDQGMGHPCLASAGTRYVSGTQTCMQATQSCT